MQKNAKKNILVFPDESPIRPSHGLIHNTQKKKFWKFSEVNSNSASTPRQHQPHWQWWPRRNTVSTFFLLIHFYFFILQLNMSASTRWTTTTATTIYTTDTTIHHHHNTLLPPPTPTPTWWLPRTMGLRHVGVSRFLVCFIFILFIFSLY